MKQHSEQFLKRRKFLLVFPLLILPFATLAFWALGGGTGNNTPVVTDQGLNTGLPVAQLKEGATDKMSLYKKAAVDSARLGEGRPASYLFEGQQDFQDGNRDFSIRQEKYGQPDAYAYNGNARYQDPNEARVRRKLQQLEKLLQQPENSDMSASFGDAAAGDQEAISPGSLDRLEKMMNTMSSGTQEDPEMEQLNGMLEKIIDIQHPERMRERMRQRSIENRGAVYGVSQAAEDIGVPVMNTVSLDIPADSNSIVIPFPRKEQNGFFGLTGNVSSDTLEENAIPAIIPETQTLVSGAGLKMQLSIDIYVNGIRIPAGTEVYGECNLSGERLQVEVNGIRYRDMMFPVSLSVYGLDAMEGIRIPGAISRDAAKKGSDRAISSMQFMDLNPSIGAQAAGVGIEAAKGLLSKKVKLVRVTINAGLTILLLDKKAQLN